MRRHWHRSTSNWAKVPIASSAARLIMRAPLARTASISAGAVLDVTVARDDQPPLPGSFRYPDMVQRGWVRYCARIADTAPFYSAARVARVRHVCPYLDQDLREAEQVSVDVVADTGWPRPLGHAARADVS